MLGGVSRCKYSKNWSFSYCLSLKWTWGVVRGSKAQEEEMIISNILPILPLRLGLYFLLEWWILDLGFRKNVLSNNEFRHNFIREVPNWCFVLPLTRIISVGSFQFGRIKGTWLYHRHRTWRNLCFDWW